MKKLFFISAIGMSVFTSHAQVGIGTNTPDASAALEISDTARGLLIPRLTAAKRAAISGPASGLMVYQTDGEKGYWYFDGSVWKSVATGGGKQTLVISDTITNDQAAAKVLADYGPNTQSIRIIGCTNLTTLDLSAVSAATDVTISDNSVLQTVNLSGLKRCEGSLKIMNCPQLTSVNLSALTSIIAGSTADAFWVANTKIGTINLSALSKLIGNIGINSNASLTSVSFSSLASGTVNSVKISDNNSLTSVAMGSLTKISADLTINNNTALSTLTLTSLSSMGYFDINKNTAITLVSFPALTGITGGESVSSSITDCSNMTNISLGNIASFSNSGLFITGNRLPSAKVNYVLSKMVAISPNITNKTISLSQLVAAAPTGQGVTDKNTLVSRGNNVYTD
jgi:hypothetical protein